MALNNMLLTFAKAWDQRVLYGHDEASTLDCKSGRVYKDALEMEADARPEEPR